MNTERRNEVRKTLIQMRAVLRDIIKNDAENLRLQELNPIKTIKGTLKHVINTMDVNDGIKQLHKPINEFKGRKP